MTDNNFVTIVSFMQFVSRQNIEQFKAKCEKKKREHPHKDTSMVEEEVKQEMMTEFKAITPK